jgi:hypothetical protein
MPWVYPLMIAAGEVVGLDAKLEIWSHDWPQKERLAKPKIACFVRVWTLSATFATDWTITSLPPPTRPNSEDSPCNDASELLVSMGEAEEPAPPLPRGSQTYEAHSTLQRCRSLTACPVAQAPGRGIRDGVSIGKIPRACFKNRPRKGTAFSRAAKAQ